MATCRGLILHGWLLSRSASFIQVPSFPELSVVESPGFGLRPSVPDLISAHDIR
jgi:hypothetical protein